VLRYPRLQRLHALAEDELYDYAQFLQDVCQAVSIKHPYQAPLRDPNDLDVLETAERGEADVLCRIKLEYELGSGKLYNTVSLPAGSIWYTTPYPAVPPAAVVP
jgi:hypothetical protein